MKQTVIISSNNNKKLGRRENLISRVLLIYYLTRAVSTKHKTWGKNKKVWPIHKGVKKQSLILPEVVQTSDQKKTLNLDTDFKLATLKMFEELKETISKEQQKKV